MNPKKQTHRVGKYIIEGLLGHGGMGTVYRAVSPETGRIVALKLLNRSSTLTEFLDETELRKIFSTEVLTMSRLNHDHIAEVLDFDFSGRVPFYTMEYFCNNLGMMIGERFIVEEPSRVIPPDRAVAYGGQILNALEYMHNAGIIHRDIKPFNMMLTDKDTVKICDFGMVKLEEEGSFTIQGINIGSPYYTAPEQISTPEKADARSDLYSAGVLIYRMLTGELPAMKDFMLSHVDPLYDKAWDSFFARALSWNPELRFQNAREMAAELTQLELHWEIKKKKACRTFVPENGPGKITTLRSAHIRASGSEAMEVFCVDKLWQPDSYIANRFRAVTEGLILDETTGIIWQPGTSDYPLDRQSADDFITALNDIGFAGVTTWRLPSVNELLSLVTDPADPEYHCRTDPFSQRSEWLWSGDRRSLKTSWYVNIRLGFTGWQNDDCLYGVRAVTNSTSQIHPN